MTLNSIRSAAVLVALTTMQQPFHAQFDHLVVAIRSLDEGVASFQKLTGVKPGIGGRHPGRGTENALVSLGDGRYLEIIAPQKDATLRPGDEMMRGLTDLTIVGWAVSVTDMETLSQRLSAVPVAPGAIQSGSRVTTDGHTLEWATLDITQPQIATAPFFIRWSPTTTHPSKTSPGGCALTALEVSDPQGATLERALSALGVEGVSLTSGAAHLGARLTCGGRAIELRSR